MWAGNEFRLSEFECGAWGKSDELRNSNSEIRTSHLLIARTRFGLRNVTIPLRRYQMPAFVFQTSSACMVDPSVSRIVIDPLAGLVMLPVETGFELTLSGLESG